jgi:hypothetical protein
MEGHIMNIYEDPHTLMRFFDIPDKDKDGLSTVIIDNKKWVPEWQVILDRNKELVIYIIKYKGCEEGTVLFGHNTLDEVFGRISEDGCSVYKEVCDPEIAKFNTPNEIVNNGKYCLQYSHPLHIKVYEKGLKLFYWASSLEFEKRWQKIKEGFLEDPERVVQELREKY